MGTRDHRRRGQPRHHHDKGKLAEPQQRSSAAVSSSSGSAAPSSIQPQSTMTPTTTPSHSTNTAADPHLSQLIQRQMVVSRALSEQEDVSLDMIQTLVRLNETVQQQEQELQQLKQKQQKPQQQQQQEQQQQKEQSLLLDTVERQRFEIEKLEQYKEEVEMAHSLLQKELDESQLKAKHQAQHVQELQFQLEQCQAKLVEKDALIQSLSLSQATTTTATTNIPNPKQNRRETAPPTVSASTSLRQRKAAREERLKEIMNRLKGKTTTAPKVRAPTRQETTFATLNLQAASILRGPPRLVVSSASSPSVSPLSQQDEPDINPSFSKDSHETLDTYVSSSTNASQDDHLVEL